MIQHATAHVFHALWDNPEQRHTLLTTFWDRVYEGASRLDIERKLQCMQAESHPDAPFPDEAMEQVQWSKLTEFLCACWYALRAGLPPPDPPADTAWDATSTPAESGLLHLHPQRDRPIRWTVPLPVLPLERKLLALGGEHMVYIGEPDLVSLLTRGEVFEGPVTRVPGSPSRCHANVARRWTAKKDDLAIATGYGLSEDGLWRQQSWLLRTHPTLRQRRVLETTVPRLTYFGFVLTRDEAEVFVQANG